MTAPARTRFLKFRSEPAGPGWGTRAAAQVLPHPGQQFVADAAPGGDLLGGQRGDSGLARRKVDLAGCRQQPHPGHRKARGRAQGHRAVAAQQQRLARRQAARRAFGQAG